MIGALGVLNAGAAGNAALAQATPARLAGHTDPLHYFSACLTQAEKKRWIQIHEPKGTRKDPNSEAQRWIQLSFPHSGGATTTP